MKVSNFFKRQLLYLNEEDRNAISDAKIALAGIGGIGGHAIEGLSRNGFNKFKLADCDEYDETNTRQLYMTKLTVGKEKVQVAKDRILSINPTSQIELFREGVNVENCLEREMKYCF